MPFESGNPYIDSSGVHYPWPRKGHTDDNVNFKSKREEIGPYLIERTNHYNLKFDLGISSPYPYMNIGMSGIQIHTGTDGRWIEFWPDNRSMVTEHNLRLTKDWILVFNLAADCLEFVNREIVAPRILKKGDKYSVEYALPSGTTSIPKGSHVFKKKWLQSSLKSSQVKSLSNVLGEQQITFQNAKLLIRKGLCVGEMESEGSLYDLTYLIANAVDSASTTSSKI
jgi:hypothetical protein